MEKTTTIVLIIVTVCAAALFSVMTYFGHQDNNRQKEVIETCIQSGGEPEIYREQFIGCRRG